MGRAGRSGGGGGGGFRSSGFGGSRGFGSHSGGSRSSFSSSSSHRSSYSSGSSHRSSWSSGSPFRGSSGGYHHHYNSGPKFYYFGGSRYTNSNYSGGYNTTRTTKSGWSVGKIIWMVILGLIILGALLPDKYLDVGSSSSSESSITKSTVDRQPLDSTGAVKTDYWYCDELNWITDPKALKRGMEHFYNKTGVQPFLYITDDVGTSGFATEKEVEKFGNEMYEKYFEDEAHLLVVFYEKNEKYRSFYIAGKEAKTVIDREAGEILLDYIDHYYYSSFDESEFFSRSFSEAADRMMRVTPNYTSIALIFAIVALIVTVLFTWWKKKKKQKLDEMKQAQDILNSDLNEFSSSAYDGSAAASDVENLKKKYDN